MHNVVAAGHGVTDEFCCFGEGPTNGFYPGPSPPGLVPGGGLSQKEGVMFLRWFNVSLLHLPWI